MSSAEINSTLNSETRHPALAPALVRTSPPLSTRSHSPASINVPQAETDVPVVTQLTDTVLGPIASPFADFTGRCFLQFCIWVDVVSAFMRTRRAQARNAASSPRGWRQYLHLRARVSPWIGTGLCVTIAGCMTSLFYASSFKTALPLAFLAVILLAAELFGREAGVLGTLAAGLIFASVLYEPRPSLAVSDPIAQTHLIWMMVIGVVISDFVGNRKLKAPIHPPRN